MKIKKVQTQVENYIDSETGEVLEQNIKTIKVVVNKDEFFLAYAGMCDVLLNKKLSKCDVELYAYLLKQCSEGREFTINAYTKEQAAKYTGRNPTSYNNSTRSLLKHGLIYKVANRTYKINPEYAFKGSSKNRNKAVIELTTNN